MGNLGSLLCKTRTLDFSPIHSAWKHCLRRAVQPISRTSDLPVAHLANLRGSWVHPPGSIKSGRFVQERRPGAMRARSPCRRTEA